MCDTKKVTYLRYFLCICVCRVIKKIKNRVLEARSLQYVIEYVYYVWIFKSRLSVLNSRVRVRTTGTRSEAIRLVLLSLAHSFLFFARFIHFLNIIEKFV